MLSTVFRAGRGPSPAPRGGPQAWFPAGRKSHREREQRGKAAERPKHSQSPHLSVSDQFPPSINCSSKIQAYKGQTETVEIASDSEDVVFNLTNTCSGFKLFGMIPWLTIIGWGWGRSQLGLPCTSLFCTTSCHFLFLFEYPGPTNIFLLSPLLLSSSCFSLPPSAALFPLSLGQGLTNVVQAALKLPMLTKATGKPLVLPSQFLNLCRGWFSMSPCHNLELSTKGV